LNQGKCFPNKNKQKMKNLGRIYKGKIQNINKVVETNLITVYTIEFKSGVCIYTQPRVSCMQVSEGEKVYFRGDKVNGTFIIKSFVNQVWKYELQDKVENVDDPIHLIINNKKWKAVNKYDELTLEKEEELHMLYEEERKKEIPVESLIAYSRQ
jgi:hypothetical protein